MQSCIINGDLVRLLQSNMTFPHITVCCCRLQYLGATLVCFEQDQEAGGIQHRLADSWLHRSQVP